MPRQPANKNILKLTKKEILIDKNALKRAQSMTESNQFEILRRQLKKRLIANGDLTAFKDLLEYRLGKIINKRELKEEMDLEEANELNQIIEMIKHDVRTIEDPQRQVEVLELWARSKLKRSELIEFIKNTPKEVRNKIRQTKYKLGA